MAAERPQGIASALWSLLDRRQQIVRWVGITHTVRDAAVAGETRTGSSGHNEQEAEEKESYGEEKGKSSSRGKVLD